VNENPLLAKAAERAVRLASEFQKVAAELDGAQLAAAFEAAVAAAPRRAEAGKAFFEPHPARRRTRAKDRDGEDLAAALVQHCRTAGKGLWMPKILPDDPDHTLELLDHRVPVKPRREDAGPGHLDAVGLLDDRLAVVKLKYVAADAVRGATGDTPLRALLEGLSDAAAAAANAAALRAELAARFQRTVSEAPPALVLAGTRRWWDLSRKRSVQKGAQWIRELERLAGQIEEACGVAVEYVGIDLPGAPPWEIRTGEGGEELPTFTQPPRLVLAWEATAGRLRSRTKTKPKAELKVEAVVADPRRPARSYRVTDSYAAGDTIQHPTLGVGVVQAAAGPGKILVLFDGTRRVLVHERPGA
jgi:hypothetical protein